MEDLFELQSEIAQLVAAEIEAIITPEEKQLIEKIPTTSLTAYDFYQQGIDEEDLDRAEEFFLRALEYDSAYALAYIGMATNHFMSTFGNAPPNEAWPKVKEYTKKALELDSTQAEAYALLGRINTNYDWDWKAAERNFKKALQLNPNSARIHIHYSVLLTYTERNEEAIVEAKRAQELDPLSSWISYMVALAYLWDHQYDRAIEELQMVLAMDPNYWQSHSQLGKAYLAKLMSEEAIAEYEKVIDLSGGGNGDMAFLAIIYYEIGEKAKAEQLFDNLMQRSRDEYVPPMFFYLIHKARGELDLAYEWLEQALNEHDSYLPWIRVDPIERYRIPDEPRFNELLKKMGLEKYQE